MRRVYIEDENGNRGYLPECHGLCKQGREECRTPTTCAGGHGLVKRVIVGALAMMLIFWLAWQIVAGILEGVRS